MDKDGIFWLAFWSIIAITICICVCLPTILFVTRDVKMANAGYVQKIHIIRPSGDWNRPIYEKIWVKESVEPIKPILEKQ
jgi:hypothetical protein